MKLLFSTLRFVLLPAAALLTVSCKNKDADTNPYASNPYYGPEGGGSAYGSGAGEYPDVQPTPPASSYDTGGYTAPPPAPAYSGGGGSTTTSSGGGGSSHTVVQGDTLFSLARRYGTSVTAIKSANGLTSDLIRTGQTLTIP
ncbi:MAG: LysM peptidoglycan-binding domain-containing protein [Verrucomicrobiae bacterium]|nr:LysM peptidoglycan-binding domain-containing protein [Verrucomicrobiae bacterium]